MNSPVVKYGMSHRAEEPACEPACPWWGSASWMGVYGNLTGGGGWKEGSMKTHTKKTYCKCESLSRKRNLMVGKSTSDPPPPDVWTLEREGVMQLDHSQQWDAGDKPPPDGRRVLRHRNSHPSLATIITFLNSVLSFMSPEHPCRLLDADSRMQSSRTQPRSTRSTLSRLSLTDSDSGVNVSVVTRLRETD